MNNQQRTPLQWRELQVFYDKNTNLAILVTKSVSQRPKYSFQLGIMKEGKFSHHLPFFTRLEGGRVTYTPYDTSAFADLMAEAEDFTQIDAKNERDRHKKQINVTSQTNNTSSETIE